MLGGKLHSVQSPSQRMMVSRVRLEWHAVEVVWRSRPSQEERGSATPDYRRGVTFGVAKHDYLSMVKENANDYSKINSTLPTTV